MIAAIRARLAGERRRLWILAGAALLLLVVGLAGPALLRGSAFFRVRRVDVVGARYLSGAEVVEAMGLAPRASLFDPLDEAEQAVIAIPGVRRATVTRRFPGTLVVRVEEFEPVALTPRQGTLALMDARGRVLPFDPTRAPADLPVAPAEARVARLVGRIRELEPGLFAAIVTAELRQDDVVLTSDGRTMLLRADAGPGQIRALSAARDDLGRKGWRYRELDARFTDRVFVRGRSS